MSGARYEEVDVSEKSGKGSCCLKFWLAAFVIISLALTGVILWLILGPKYAENSGSNGQGVFILLNIF